MKRRRGRPSTFETLRDAAFQQAIEQDPSLDVATDVVEISHAASSCTDVAPPFQKGPVHKRSTFCEMMSNGLRRTGVRDFANKVHQYALGAASLKDVTPSSHCKAFWERGPGAVIANISKTAIKLVYGAGDRQTLTADERRMASSADLEEKHKATEFLATLKSLPENAELLVIIDRARYDEATSIMRVLQANDIDGQLDDEMTQEDYRILSSFMGGDKHSGQCTENAHAKVFQLEKAYGALARVSHEDGPSYKFILGDFADGPQLVQRTGAECISVALEQTSDFTDDTIPKCRHRGRLAIADRYAAQEGAEEMLV